MFNSIQKFIPIEESLNALMVNKSWKHCLLEWIIISRSKTRTLIWASRTGQLSIMKFIVSRGANIHVNDDYFLRCASRDGHLDMVKFLVSKGANIHALNDYAVREASSKGYFSVVEFLTRKGANIHAKNDSAFQWARLEGHSRVVKFLESNRAK